MARYAALVALGLVMSTSAYAAPMTSDTFTASYTAANTFSSAGTPTVSDTLTSPLSGTLGAGQTTTPTNFLLVSPTKGSGLVTGSIVVDFSLSDAFASPIVGVTNTPGANTASLVNGKVQFDGNYAINYATQTDCITWAGSCTPAATGGAIKTQLTNTVAVSFADGAVLDLNLYDWSDWDMQPEISFGFTNAPVPVPEPASLALFAAALAGLAFLQRRRWMAGA